MSGRLDLRREGIEEGLLVGRHVGRALRLGQPERGEHGAKERAAAAERCLECLVRAPRGTSWRTVEVVVVRHADEPRVLCPHEHLERDAGRLEAVDDPHAVGVPCGVSPFIVRPKDPLGPQVLDTLQRVADELGQVGGRQSRAVRRRGVAIVHAFGQSTCSPHTHPGQLPAAACTLAGP